MYPNPDWCNRISLVVGLCLKVPTTMDAFMLYGPVVRDGYGVCYNPHPDYMVVCVASFHSSPDTDSRALADTLVDSLRQMKDLCTAALPR